ncbi:hypothetical protein BCR32DRAFT_293438 [Anaeromyces robustus]|uniref:Uncharacterized protein n=1 Tax=Anaeromyces robustus TaxID=1754192 RepID=A0A1Y1X5N3_9FUNG|nr:hypothetical protein BCR32DRAFT_293438 [Anaeromyces robustus]|eukprot:ORX81119.1 hypothetical protein BCR32DRAFT_293438 [Anaeromyces robustus]
MNNDNEIEEGISKIYSWSLKTIYFLLKIPVVDPTNNDFIENPWNVQSSNNNSLSHPSTVMNILSIQPVINSNSYYIESTSSVPPPSFIEQPYNYILANIQMRTLKIKWRKILCEQQVGHE